MSKFHATVFFVLAGDERVDFRYSHNGAWHKGTCDASRTLSICLIVSGVKRVVYSCDHGVPTAYIRAENGDRAAIPTTHASINLLMQNDDFNFHEHFDSAIIIGDDTDHLDLRG